jgi:hypothetical protein
MLMPFRSLTWTLERADGGAAVESETGSCCARRSGRCCLPVHSSRSLAKLKQLVEASVLA